MTSSQLPGYLGKELLEGLPLLFTSSFFFAFSPFFSSEEEDLCHNRAFTSTSLKTALLGLIIITATADRALRGNINHNGLRNKPQNSFSFHFLITAVYTDELLNYESHKRPNHSG